LKSEWTRPAASTEKCDPLLEGRLAECGEARQLSFVPKRYESESRGRVRVGPAQAVDRLRRQQAFFAAVYRRQGIAGEMAMAVMDGIAAGIGRHQQCVVPRGMEQRRQRMRLMVVVEEGDRVVAETACGLEPRNIKNIVDDGRVVTPQLGQHEPTRVLLDVLAVLLAQPANAADGLVISGRKLAQAPADCVDVRPRGAHDCEHLVDAGVRIGPSVVLVTRQALERHRGTQRIILKDRGCGVMTARVYG
jgi:hypothetical protein